MFSKEDLEGDTILDKIGSNTLVVKYIELYTYSQRVLLNNDFDHYNEIVY